MPLPPNFAGWRCKRCPASDFRCAIPPRGFSPRNVPATPLGPSPLATRALASHKEPIPMWGVVGVGHVAG